MGLGNVFLTDLIELKQNGALDTGDQQRIGHANNERQD